MTDFNSSQYWRETTNYQSFELRAHRFRSDMLPVFYKWLGITPASKVLDGGCGSGVFTRYLAGGLISGHITGFDINEGFIAYGRTKAAELSLTDKMTLDVADGYNLPYPDSTFDAVTNYTYIGVLSDPQAGLRELTRVCKPGGVVSCVVARNAIPNIGWQGGYHFAGAGELQRLTAIESRIFSKIPRKTDSINRNEAELFKACGLNEIHMYPFAHLICYNDMNLPLEYRKTLALEETRDEITWLKSRYEDNREYYTEYNFSQADYEQLLLLQETKYDYLNAHFETDDSFEWHGGFNYIVTGKK